MLQPVLQQRAGIVQRRCSQRQLRRRLPEVGIEAHCRMSPGHHLRYPHVCRLLYAASPLPCVPLVPVGRVEWHHHGALARVAPRLPEDFRDRAAVALDPHFGER